jgi:hypothetical protein
VISWVSFRRLSSRSTPDWPRWRDTAAEVEAAAMAVTVDVEAAAAIEVMRDSFLVLAVVDC